MSYNIQLYRKEVKDKHLLSGDDDFFEKIDNLLPFTDEQKEKLDARLEKYGYKFVAQIMDCIEYNHPDNGVIVLMTNCGLYFSTSSSNLFEIMMMSSEFTDTGEYAKYDPQQGEWENL